jgi:predicted phosphoribosyltransferase
MTAHHFHDHAIRRPTAWSGSSLGGAPASETCGFMGFPDRRTAGRILADWVRPVVDDDAIVLGVAGGGLVVAAEVASELERPLDCILVRAVTVAGFPCAQVAAIAQDGTVARDHARASRLGISPAALRSAVIREEARLDDRPRACATGIAPIAVEDRHVLLVDEALDSGIVAIAAVSSLKRRGAAAVTVAVPVGDRTAVAYVARIAHEVIAVLEPAAAGDRQSWYQDLPVVPDAEVAELLASRFAR